MTKEPVTNPAGVRRRRGRPRADELEQRRRDVIEAAYAELIERGYQQVTMSAIAERAASSKETLYSWFGSREGLFAALITENADTSAAHVRAALDRDADHVEVLVGYATGLLQLLTSDRSVALNRAAMSSPELAATLLASGRHRVGPIVEEYLRRLADRGLLELDSGADEAFTLLYGLVVRDTQIRVLLGEVPPSRPALERRARSAVADFLRLRGP